jgi:hypothetical protein
LSFNGNTDWIRFVGRAYSGEHNEVNERAVTPDYFTTLRAKLLRGRVFTDAEDLGKPDVVVINQTLAKKFFPGEDPIGQRFGDTTLSLTVRPVTDPNRRRYHTPYRLAHHDFRSDNDD